MLVLDPEHSQRRGFGAGLFCKSAVALVFHWHPCRSAKEPRPAHPRHFFYHFVGTVSFGRHTSNSFEARVQKVSRKDKDLFCWRLFSCGWIVAKEAWSCFRTLTDGVTILVSFSTYLQKKNICRLSSCTSLCVGLEQSFWSRWDSYLQKDCFFLNGEMVQTLQCLSTCCRHTVNFLLLIDLLCACSINLLLTHAFEFFQSFWTKSRNIFQFNKIMAFKDAWCLFLPLCSLAGLRPCVGASESDVFRGLCQHLQATLYISEKPVQVVKMFPETVQITCRDSSPQSSCSFCYYKDQ